MHARDLPKLIFLILNTTILLLFIQYPISAYYSDTTYPFELPIKPNTPFYLTATPLNHSQDSNRAAIDFQIPDEFGFIDKGAPLYSPFDGYAQITRSPNESLTLEITKTDKEWKLILSHIMDDTKKAQMLNASYPKHVLQGELVAYQGDSGYTNAGRYPVHVHFEIFKLVNGEYTNDNRLIDICSKVRLKHHCDWIDESGYIKFVYDK